MKLIPYPLVIEMENQSTAWKYAALDTSFKLIKNKILKATLPKSWHLYVEPVPSIAAIKIQAKEQKGR